MLICEHCESAQCLQITESKTLTTTPVDGRVEISIIYEEIECTLCGLTGEAVWDLQDETALLDGGIVEVDERPCMASAPKRGETA